MHCLWPSKGAADWHQAPLIHTRQKRLKHLPSLFSWWVDQAVLEYHHLRLEAEQAGTNVKHAVATWRVKTPSRAPLELHGLLQMCGQQVLTERSLWRWSEQKWQNNMNLATHCDQYMRSAVLWCIPHPLRGPRCHLLVSISQGLWGRSKVFSWIIQGCFRRRRKRRNTGRLVPVLFLIVWQAMKATRLGCFWPYKDGGNSTAQSTPRNHCKYSTVWISGSCLEPSESSTHRHQQKYKPQWHSLFAQKHYVKFNENSTQP